jgi:hypothetical protein
MHQQQRQLIFCYKAEAGAIVHISTKLIDSQHGRLLERDKRANRNYWTRFLLISFVVGAIVGTTGDYVHVITHTDGYPRNGSFPFLPFSDVKMPVWVPFLFGTAVMLMGATHKFMSRLYHPRFENHFIISSSAPLLFVAMYAWSGFSESNTGGMRDVELAIMAILIWAILDGTKTGAFLALVNAFIGTGFEIFLVSIGGFFYYPHHSNLFGVPSWLPWLYMAASVCISLFVRLI